METTNPKATEAGPAGEDVVSAGQETVGRIAEKLSDSVKASKVYGDPVERAGVTVIPVARARWGFGGGGGRSRRDERGSGGGGGATMSPIGYIEIGSDGTTQFRRIVASRDLVAIGALALLASLIASRILRAN